MPDAEQCRFGHSLFGRVSLERKPESIEGLRSRAVPLRVDDLVAQPGERVQGYLAVGEGQDGSSDRIPIVLLRGSEPGPLLYVQAVSDGDELNGVGVLQRFLREVDVSALNGGIIAVPIVNLPAFRARQAYNPVDGKKMNRCFPGSPDGSSSERIAHALFQKAIRHADLCLDLHQGGTRPMIDEVRVRVGSNHPMHEACLELARVFGIGYILDQQGPAGQLAQVAPDHKIPTIDPELGGCVGWDENSIRKGLRGLWNVLYHYGFASGLPETPETQVIVRDFVAVRPMRGGFFHRAVALYEHVRTGQVLGVMRDVFGEEIELLAAPTEGVVWSHSAYPMAASGETVLTVGVKVEWMNRGRAENRTR